MKINKIGTVEISPERPFLIAEAGVNHEGSLRKALDYVDAAAACGADMIKFQSYKAETLASKNSPAYWDRSKEAADSQYALFKRYDSLDVADYEQLKQRCDEKGILFATTPFDLRFADALDHLMVLYKIASADITNNFLLERVASKGKPILLSTGASTVGEIEAAVALLQNAGAQEIGLLHCILQYPTPPENAHLRVIKHLSNVFPELTIGWSDHVPPVGGCLAALAAWMLGASIIEKHFTLDKSLPGNDHYHAMDPDDVVAFRAQTTSIAAMLGEGRKRVFPCEEPARKQARRSLVAARAIPRGAPITEDVLIAKRPGTGIAPANAQLLLGRAALVDIAADDVLTWDMFIPSAQT